jgi:hypothetical protein
MARVSFGGSMSLLKAVSLLAFLLMPSLMNSQSIPASEATKHLGEQETVCSKIAEVHTASSSRGMPTFIDFDKPYPNQTFTAVIWQSDKERVGAVPHDGSLCVKGTITEYRGRPEIVLHAHTDWSIPGKAKSTATISNDKHYTNVDGQSVHSPAYSSNGIPAGATAQCGDGTFSFSTHRQGTCSHHGGVARWL